MEKRHEDLSGLIDKLLESKDPATVGLRRIIKQKRDTAEDFPMQSMAAEDFSKHTTSTAGRVFSEDEKRILELERELLRQKSEIDKMRKQNAADIESTHSKALAQGREEGRREGHAKAEDEFNAKFSDIVGRIAAYINGIEARRNSLYNEVYSDALDVALAAVKRIIVAETSATNSEIALRVIRSAISYIAERKNLVIRLNSADLAAIDGKTGLWAGVSDRLDNVRVQSDDRISRGGCMIESTGGLVDARMETQIAAVGELVSNLWNDALASTTFEPDAQHDDLAKILPEIADVGGTSE